MLFFEEAVSEFVKSKNHKDTLAKVAKYVDAVIVHLNYFWKV